MLRVVEGERTKKKASLLQIKTKSTTFQFFQHDVFPPSEDQPIFVHVDFCKAQGHFVVTFCRILTAPHTVILFLLLFCQIYCFKLCHNLFMFNLL